MDEFQKLKSLFKMYVKSRDKEERNKIKEIITKILYDIHQDAIISNIDIDRNNNRIKYNVILKHEYKEKEGFFIFSESAKKYYFNGLQFTAL